MFDLLTTQAYLVKLSLIVNQNRNGIPWEQLLQHHRSQTCLKTQSCQNNLWKQYVMSELLVKAACHVRTPCESSMPCHWLVKAVWLVIYPLLSVYSLKWCWYWDIQTIIFFRIHKWIIVAHFFIRVWDIARGYTNLGENQKHYQKEGWALFKSEIWKARLILDDSQRYSEKSKLTLDESQRDN